MLRFAILQLLYRRPLTGYEIKQRFDNTLMFCWHALHSQIYQELKKMRKAGLVTVRTEVQVGKPNRQVYSITKEGLEELKHWLATPIDALKLKDELLLRLYSVHLLEPAAARALLQRAEELHAERLSQYEQILDRLRSNNFTGDRPKAPWALGPYLDLVQGIMHERMYLEWIRWATQQLEQNEPLLAEARQPLPEPVR